MPEIFRYTFKLMVCSVILNIDQLFKKDVQRVRKCNSVWEDESDEDKFPQREIFT